MIISSEMWTILEGRYKPKTRVTLRQLQRQFNEEYEMKDLGELKYFLGIQVHRNRGRKIIHISQSGRQVWFTDSGASDHFSPHRSLFETFRMLDKPIPIETAQGTAIGTGMGTITLTVLGKSDIETDLHLNDVIYAPNMNSNLFSLAAVYDRGFETRITPGYGLRIFHGETLVATTVRVHGGLFRLRTTNDSYAMAAQVSEKTKSPNVPQPQQHRRPKHPIKLQRQRRQRRQRQTPTRRS